MLSHLKTTKELTWNEKADLQNDERRLRAMEKRVSRSQEVVRRIVINKFQTNFCVEWIHAWWYWPTEFAITLNLICVPTHWNYVLLSIAISCPSLARRYSRNILSRSKSQGSKEPSVIVQNFSVSESTETTKTSIDGTIAQRLWHDVDFVHALLSILLRPKRCAKYFISYSWCCISSFDVDSDSYVCSKWSWHGICAASWWWSWTSRSSQIVMERLAWYDQRSERLLEKDSSGNEHSVDVQQMLGMMQRCFSSCWRELTIRFLLLSCESVSLKEKTSLNHVDFFVGRTNTSIKSSCETRRNQNSTNLLSPNPGKNGQIRCAAKACRIVQQTTLKEIATFGPCRKRNAWDAARRHWRRDWTGSTHSIRVSWRNLGRDVKGEWNARLSLGASRVYESDDQPLHPPHLSESLSFSRASPRQLSCDQDKQPDSPLTWSMIIDETSSDRDADCLQSTFRRDQWFSLTCKQTSWPSVDLTERATLIRLSVPLRCLLEHLNIAALNELRNQSSCWSMTRVSWKGHRVQQPRTTEWFWSDPTITSNTVHSCYLIAVSESIFYEFYKIASMIIFEFSKVNKHESFTARWKILWWMIIEVNAMEKTWRKTSDHH